MAFGQRVATRDVVLLDAPERLDRALRAALSPWGMRVERVVRPKPIPTLPGTALNAAALARELDAKVLVWLSSNDDGAALWIYETSKDTITVRPFPDKPIDQALAAALALSVKTWLRTSDLRSETPVPQEAPEPSVPVVVAAVVPEKPSIPAASGPPSNDDTVGFQVVIHAAVRRGAFRPAAFETRYGVDVRLSPWQSNTGATRLWLGAGGDLGEPRGIDNAAFRGVYSEWGGGVSAGLAHRFGEALGVALHLGAVLHWARLSGTLLRDTSAAGRGQLGAAAQIRPELELSFGPIGIIVQPTVGASLRGEQFKADGEEVLETQPVWWMLGGAVRVDVF